MGLLRRQPRRDGAATIRQVEMLKRMNYGTATARVTVAVEPAGGAVFELVREAKVRMAR